MPTALIAALLASYSYGVISGTSNPCLGAELTLFAGAQLAMAAALTMFSITWLLRDYTAHRIAIKNARFLSFGVAAIVAFFLKTAIGDEVSFQMPDLLTVQWAVAASVPVLIGVLGIATQLGDQRLTAKVFRLFETERAPRLQRCLRSAAAASQPS